MDSLKDKYFSERINQINDRIIEINRKYGCGQFPRSKEDEDKWQALYLEREKIEEEWDLTYPAEPCPKCGCARKASFNFGQECLNFRKCDLAAKYLGG